MTRTLLPPRTRLDSSLVVRVLDHQQTARLARKAWHHSGLKVRHLADAAGVHYQTAHRFLGLVSGSSQKRGNTIDPRTNTTRRIMGALGYELVFLPKKSTH